MVEPIIVAAILSEELVLALIELLISLQERRASTDRRFRSNLKNVEIDLGIINDVLTVIQKRNKKKLPDGIKTWKAEAESVVNDTKTLLERIDKKNPFSGSDQNEGTDDSGMITCWLCCNKTALQHSKEDAQELESLTERLQGITKHNATVLALLRESRCFPL